MRRCQRLSGGSCHGLPTAELVEFPAGWRLTRAQRTRARIDLQQRAPHADAVERYEFDRYIHRFRFPPREGGGRSRRSRLEKRPLEDGGSTGSRSTSTLTLPSDVERMDEAQNRGEYADDADSVMRKKMHLRCGGR